MNQTKPTYKQQGNVGLFDSDETMEKLNKLGNPLDKLSKAVDFEMFRDTLERGLYKEKFTKMWRENGKNRGPLFFLFLRGS